MRQGKTSFMKMRNEFSPFSLITGGITDSPNGEVKKYRLPEDEWERYKNEPYKPPTDINGRKLGKPSRPPGGGGVA